MGWSCSADAAKTLRGWEDVCRAENGSSNTYTVEGVQYFFETARKEHDDGAITGYVFKMNTAAGTCKRCGTFRIEANGNVSKGPGVLRAVMLRNIRAKYLAPAAAGV